MTGALVIDGFWAVWNGESPVAGDVLGTDESPELVAELDAGGRIELDPTGRIRGIHGVTLDETVHSIARAGRVVHTWCAFDAIGIPAALGITADAVTACPTCGSTLTVHVADGEPLDGGALSLWFPGFDRCGHVRNDFCTHANLYCNRDHLEAAEPSGGQVLTVEEAAALGRATWADVAGAIGNRP